jgi:hypothetical protein
MAKGFDADEFPAVDEQDEYLQTECTKVATKYAGGDDVIGDKKLTVYWDNLTEDSCKAGTRRVNCNWPRCCPIAADPRPSPGGLRTTCLPKSSSPSTHSQG